MSIFVDVLRDRQLTDKQRDAARTLRDKLRTGKLALSAIIRAPHLNAIRFYEPPPAERWARSPEYMDVQVFCEMGNERSRREAIASLEAALEHVRAEDARLQSQENGASHAA